MSADALLDTLNRWAEKAEPIVNLAATGVAIHAGIQTAKHTKEHRRAIGRQESLQRKAHADAQMHKAHSEREVAWRRSQSRKRVRQSGYMAFPTGWE